MSRLENWGRLGAVAVSFFTARVLVLSSFPSCLPRLLLVLEVSRFAVSLSDMFSLPNVQHV